MRKNACPPSSVHALPAARSDSMRKLENGSGLHDVTGFWNGKSSQIKPARGLQAGILPEKRHFSGVWKRNTNRHAENDFTLSAEWFVILLRLNCIYAENMQNKNAYTIYGSPVFGLSDKTKTLSFWTEILPYSNKKTFYETEEQKNKKIRWLLRGKYVLLCLCLISLSTNPPTIFRPTEN